MDMYKRKFWLDQEQPNLGYADVKLNIACMHPLACVHTFSLCVYYDLYEHSTWQAISRISATTNKLL